MLCFGKNFGRFLFLFAVASVLTALGSLSPQGAARAEDWPMWGYDAARTGMTPMELPDTLHLHWVRQMPAPRRAWPHQWDDGDKLEFDLSYSPVVMGDRMFVASMTNDSLTAYDVDTGAQLWRYYADGPMRLAPAAWEGKVYAVSDDGHLHCVDAASGELLWKFDARPSDHRVLGNTRVISMWAARGGPLVKDGTVYFAAGVWPFLGTFVFAVDAETGAEVWSNTGHATEWQAQPHGGAYSFAGVAPQGYLAASGDRLVVSGGRSFPAIFARPTGKVLHTQVRGPKVSGGYRVRIHDGRYYNHGLRYRLSDGGSAGSGELVNEALAERVEAVKDQLDAKVFEYLAARDRLFVVTHAGTIYCFGPDEREATVHGYAPQTPALRDDAAGFLAEEIVLESGHRDGYALFMGAGDGDLIEQVAIRSDLHIVAIEPDAEKVAALRQRFDAAGLYGERIALIHGHPTDSHYPQYVSSLVIMEDPAALGRAPDAELLRTVYDRLRPYDGAAGMLTTPQTEAAFNAALEAFQPEAGAKGWLNGAVFLQRTGPLPGSGQWTHQYADPAQSVLSHDRRVRPPFGPIWFGGPTNENILPRHSLGPRPQVVSGRVSILGVETISARCVFSGRELWVREFPGIGHPFTNLELEERWEAGRQVYMTNQPGSAYIGSPYVTLPDGVYIRYQGRVIRLDPATGETMAEWTLPARPTERDEPDWGHISVQGDYVVTTTNPHIWGGGRLGTWGDDSWDGTSSEQLVVMDRHTGEVLWTRDAAIGFRHTAIASGNGRLFVNDRLSEQALEFAQRRGMEVGEQPRLYALDIRTGDVLWTSESEVFGTFFSYSVERDILLEGGSRDTRRIIRDEITNRLIARRGEDGEILWRRSGTHHGPLVLRGDMVISGRPGPAFSLLTGENLTREHPVTAEEQTWSYWKAYGCGMANASEHLLLFRSGAAGYTDLERDGGSGDLGGFRAGCTANMIAADGVLNAPDYTRTCGCSYQNQTSLGLIHMPEMEMWMSNRPVSRVRGSVARLGVNIGAPGDRRAEDGTLWTPWPPTDAPGPNLSTPVVQLAGTGEAEIGVLSVEASGGTQPESTLDGDPYTQWAVDDAQRGVFNHWIAYKLSEPITLDRMEVAWFGPEGTLFRIETTEDPVEQVLDMALPTEGWRFRTDPEEVGEEAGWFEVDHDDAEWETFQIGRSWTHFNPYEEYIGAGWYRITLELPEWPAGHAPAEVRLVFGGVDEEGWVWVNGQFVGSHAYGPTGWNVPFELPVGDAVRWGEENQITIRAQNSAAAGGVWRPVHLQAERAGKIGWQRLHEGVRQEAKPATERETYAFEPTKAHQIRIFFGEHGDERTDSRGRRVQQSVGVSQVRIGDLPFPEAYAAFTPKEVFRKHSLFVDGANGLNWVAASGVRGVQVFELPGVNGGGQPYTVALHFSEPDNLQPGQRVFDILLQGELKTEAFDIAQEAGGPDRAVVKAFNGVNVDESLRIELKPRPESEHTPILCGVELVRE